MREGSGDAVSSAVLVAFTKKSCAPTLETRNLKLQTAIVGVPSCPWVVSFLNEPMSK